LEVVVCKIGPLLFQFAFGDVPVAFQFECIHGLFRFVWLTRGKIPCVSFFAFQMPLPREHSTYNISRKRESS
jgi:hypothetical protein